ncbi:MAG TPA: hypothetical protein VG815_05375 [Chloroflexota bacterium]|jgi:hypothetical protein|nr:hypothetical protein [Chloroflexota bacterium]
MTTRRDETDARRGQHSSEHSVIHTRAGSFKVEGSAQEILRRIAAEEWPAFTLADSDEPVIVRSSTICAVQDLRSQRTRVGFRP